MGVPQRPNEAVRHDLAIAYDKSHVKWITFYGHITNVKELCDVFKINHITVIKRLKADWPLEAALTAPIDQQWTKNNIVFWLGQKSVFDTIIKTLDKHFNPKNAKNKKVNNGVIDGGHF